MIRELLKSVFKRPATLKYPFEKRSPFKGFRGRPLWDMKLCTGCGLCPQICPSEAIEMIGNGQKEGFRHYLDRCLFCGQCAEDCPVDAITMTAEYELARYNRAEMMLEFKREEKTSEQSNPTKKTADSINAR